MTYSQANHKGFVSESVVFPWELLNLGFCRVFCEQELGTQFDSPGSIDEILSVKLGIETSTIIVADQQYIKLCGARSCIPARESINIITCFITAE